MCSGKVGGGRSLEESELVARARGGDAAAYEEMVRRYQQVAFRTAYLITRDAQEAEEVAQDAFVRAYQALPRFAPGRPFRPWLLRIVANLAINARQARLRRRGLLQRWWAQPGREEPAPSPEAAAVTEERRSELLEAVRMLKPWEQTAIYVHFFLELPEREAATVLGCRPGTVKSRVHRASRHLRDVIERHFPALVERGERSARAPGPGGERSL